MASFLNFGFDNVDLWRSEEMQLVQLIIPSDSAHDTIAALGDVGMLQFKDLNAEKSAFQRTYANQVKRCEEMARKLRFFTENVEKAGIKIQHRLGWDANITVDELESKLEDLSRELLEMNSNSDRLNRSVAELTEMQVMLDQGAQFFDSARAEAVRSASAAGPTMTHAASQDFSKPLLGPDREASVIGGGGGGFGGGAGHGSALDKVGRLGFVSGLLPAARGPAFERLLFRATRGNMLLRTADAGKVQDPASGETVDKVVFVVFFAGERARVKINKICEAFGANRYPFPEDLARQRAVLGEVRGRLGELRATCDAGDMQRLGLLRSVADNLDQWITLVRREKAIYHTLNKLSLDTSSKVLVGEAWVPSSARPLVAEALKGATERSADSTVTPVIQPLTTHHELPPTYFRTNKFTEAFQTIVDAYGIARYREVNPAVFTIMTFPFLFAVMFGDVGHAALMLVFALLLVLNEKRLGKGTLDDISAMAYGGRYVILLMSLFSLFTGALYNEFFSMPMNLAGDTHFGCKVTFNSTDDVTTDFFRDDIRNCRMHARDPESGRVCGADGVSCEVQFLSSSPYAFGVDPVWRGTVTELPFLNSMKMKLSILLGVIHMDLGVLMSLFNNQYFRDRLSTWAEFVPQIIFLNGLFGYLCILIVAKWVLPGPCLTDLYKVMIGMFLSPGHIPDTNPAYMFPGQGELQLVLLLVALVAVPWMLLPKPLILKARHKAAMAGQRDYERLENDTEHGPSAAAPAAAGGGGHDSHGGHDGHFDFGEVFVHQMIHTIEFVLGAVSNTASYLRLWALSLAHSQLSAVFYDKVLMGTINMSGGARLPAMVIGFFVWACATMGVLMIMESLSAFLHALRLHWVEFQNKFYRGDGYQFVPFNLRTIQGAASKED